MRAKAKPIAGTYLEEVGRSKIHLSTKVLEKKANKPVEKTGNVLKEKEKAERLAKWASRRGGDLKETKNFVSSTEGLHKDPHGLGLKGTHQKPSTSGF